MRTLRKKTGPCDKKKPGSTTSDEEAASSCARTTTEHDVFAANKTAKAATDSGAGSADLFALGTVLRRNTGGHEESRQHATKKTQSRTSDEKACS